MNEFKELRDSIWDRAWNGGLDSAELLVLLRLVEHMPRIFPNLKTLERWTRLDERTIRRAIRRLEQDKILRTQHNPGRGNLYQFLDSDGNPIVIRGIGPRTLRPDTPVTMTGHPGHHDRTTPVTMTAEADPDPKQDPKQTREAEGDRPAPPIASTRKVAYFDLDGWEPSASLEAEAAMQGIPVDVFRSRIAELRNGPIAGTRGTFDRDKYVRLQFPRWRTWREQEAAELKRKPAAQKRRTIADIEAEGSL